ncbi:quinolinate synthetase [candidate division KSB1 bacterium 4484_87]|nr:MAG: quinolinate synthetase [candidate division KSB1 bacterium 4484_87]
MLMPDKYRQISIEELSARIHAVKAKLGKKLVILGHHYQRDEVLEFADFRGDSFGLSKVAAEQEDAKYIVFCGVHFMAEAADILTAEHQIVHIPEMSAGCPLADFANLVTVSEAWEEIIGVVPDVKITPITYINSTAGLKAFCGKNNGTVCTSSNAAQILEWALKNSDKVFFFPDQFLGSNTANKLGIEANKKIIWDSTLPLGGNSHQQIENAKVILWKGYCHVHSWFKLEHIASFRRQFPGGKVIVHPECPEEIVNAADADGSTSQIISYVKSAPKGSTVAVGTEINLVNRLSNETKDKTVLPLARSLCPNMYKINLHNLCFTLENLGQKNIVHVPADIARDASLALERMLTLS